MAVKLKYGAPNNNVRYQREEVLGWTQEQLAITARTILGSDLTSRTISRLEAGDKYYARVTFTRVLAAINYGWRQAGLEPISHDDLFPHFGSSGLRKPAGRNEPSGPIQSEQKSGS